MTLQQIAQEIREFRMSDIPGVVEIQNANNPTQPTTVESMEAIESGRNPEDTFQQWVIEREGRIAAYADCGKIHATEADDTHHIWVTVHPDFGGQGLGIVLFEKAVEFTRAHGCSLLVTACAGDSERATGWLTKRGFENLGGIDEYNLDLASFDFTKVEGIVGEYEAKGFVFSNLQEQLDRDPNYLHMFYETLALPLIQEIVYPDGATINPSFDEFKAMCIDRAESTNESNFIVFYEGRPVGWSALFDLGGGRAYINFAQVTKDVRDTDLYIAMLVLTAKTAKDKGSDLLALHSDGKLSHVNRGLDLLGLVRKPGRVVFRHKIEDVL